MTAFSDETGGEALESPQHIVEGIILRRLHDKRIEGYTLEMSKEIAAALSASPDREALKEFIVSASFASRAALDSDTIFCEIYTPGYQPAKKGSFGFFVKELRAILSLLSGASTKSDGVEGHAGPGTRIAVHGESGERIAPERYAVGEAGIKPGPSDSLPSKTLTEGEKPRPQIESLPANDSAETRLEI